MYFMDVKSATRLLDLFEAFAVARKPCTLSELSRALGVPVSSCHALVKTLEGRGYLYGSGGRGGLYPTRRLFAVAQTIAAHEPLIERLRPALIRLRDETRETVILGKRQGDRIIYLEVLESLQTIRYSAQPGDLKPLHSSAIGKAVLGSLDPGELAALLPRLPLDRVTDATLVDPAALVADLAAARERGDIYITRGENVADVMAAAVPFQAGGETFGVAIAGPLYRMNDALPNSVHQLQHLRAAVETSV
jgi:IclR family transcriptional regulator, acetate operon repressor